MDLTKDMKYLILLLGLVGCVDTSTDTEFNLTVYQFAHITVDDTIPGTVLVWTSEDAREVMRRVNLYRNVCPGGWAHGLHTHYNLAKCNNEKCFQWRRTGGRLWCSGSRKRGSDECSALTTFLAVLVSGSGLASEPTSAA
jgi:hypothetical protein